MSGVASFWKRHWFLLAMAASIGVSLAAPNAIGPVVEPWPPHVVVVAALFLMAWTMPSQRLGEELSRPWAAAWAMAVSYGFLPAVSFLVGSLAPTPDLRMGLLLASAVPCTLASCVLWTRLAGGNEATALVAVLGCTLASWLVTPLILEWTAGSRVEIDARQMMLDLALTLLVPVALGQAARFWQPARRFANQHRTPLSALAQIFVLAMVVKTAANVGLRLQTGDAVFDRLTLVLSGVLPIVVHVAALHFGYRSAGWLGFDRGRRIAIAFCGSQKTLPVSVFLFERYYQEEFPLAVVPLLVFHVGQLLYDTVAAHRWKEAEATKNPEP